MCGFTARPCSLPLVLRRPAEALSSKPAIWFYTTMSHGAYLSVVHLINTSLTNIFFFVSGVLDTQYLLLPLHFLWLFFITLLTPDWRGIFQVSSYQPTTPKTVLFKYFSPCFRRKSRNWKFFLCLSRMASVSDIMAPTHVCFWRTLWLDLQGIFHTEKTPSPTWIASITL